MAFTNAILLLMTSVIPQTSALVALRRIPPVDAPRFMITQKWGAAKPLPFAEFKEKLEMFHSRSSSQPTVAEEAAAGTKLLIGVMSMGYQANYREVHRSTWMSHPGVCTISEHARPDCHVIVAFVLGKNNATDALVTAESQRYGDVIIPILDSDPGSHSGTAPLVTAGAAVEDPASLELSFLEDPTSRYGLKGLMQKQKTFSWLMYAGEHFTWATHVAKMDMDSYPFLGRMLADLASATGSSPKVKGQEPPEGWSDSAGGLYYGHGMGWKAFYMRQASLYLMSMSTARCALQKPLHCGGCPSEDSMIGEQISYMSKQNGGPCPDPWYVDVPVGQGWQAGWQNLGTYWRE